jgi:hypothetical protein
MWKLPGCFTRCYWDIPVAREPGELQLCSIARLEALLKAVDILEQHLDYSETARVMAMSMAHLSAPSKDYNVLQRHIDPSSTQQVIASSAARLDALSNAYNILQRRHRYSKTEGVTATFGSSSRSSLEGQHHTITASR